ncbi:hypothetical protein CLQ_14503 (plasmid) [Clostridium botulinum Af84]|uniref:hypothetical protein n=1 Tax=Clostridium botulinum TaxID=1491 RepID=UPI00035BAC6E|nr:hypothetical protein [Clostridium botulinum]APR02779.1 hypothetical protein RSJ2_3767 [Clostridium botulinum]AUN19822.1 hypothetical protein B2M06_19960 [Clostridium botulinum]EPS54506.1 hypothetical protein CLQ_14503 [Clostridium botulinum Af84]NFM84396.1 hypothetical protein [Clostridium botulinum]NFP13231.1 hypothetical protein [Clostridium botulinum]
MGNSMEILKESFLKEYIDEEFNWFKYSNGILYIGHSNLFLNKSKIQPTKEELMKLVCRLTGSTDKEFNQLNPLLRIIDKPICIIANLLHDDLSIEITL